MHLKEFGRSPESEKIVCQSEKNEFLSLSAHSETSKRYSWGVGGRPGQDFAVRGSLRPPKSAAGHDFAVRDSLRPRRTGRAGGVKKSKSFIKFLSLACKTNEIR